MSIPAPLDLHAETVQRAWVDYNGHLNVAYYVLVFDHATDAFFDFVGIGEDYAERTEFSTFALEAHVTYQREVLEGTRVQLTTQLLDRDRKRLHYFHRMCNAAGEVAATLEQVSLHVDLNRRCSTPMPGAILQRLDRIMEAHGCLPWPPEAGASVGLRKGRS